MLNDRLTETLAEIDLFEKKSQPSRWARLASVFLFSFCASSVVGNLILGQVAIGLAWLIPLVLAIIGLYILPKIIHRSVIQGIYRRHGICSFCHGEHVVDDCVGRKAVVRSSS